MFTKAIIVILSFILVQSRVLQNSDTTFRKENVKLDVLKEVQKLEEYAINDVESESLTAFETQLQLDILAELNKLKDYIVDKVKAGLKKFENLDTEIVNFANKLLEDIQKNVLGNEDNIMKRFNEVIAEATKLGIDIHDCVKNEGDYLKTLPNTFKDKAVSCVKDKLSEAEGVIHDAMVKVNGSIQLIKDLARQWNDCGSGWTAAFCKTKVGYEITKESVSIPIQLTQNVNDAVNLVMQLRSSLQQCAVVIVEQLLYEGEAVVDRVEQCVAGKYDTDKATTETDVW